MTLTLDEQLLVSHYRNLTAAAQQDLLQYAEKLRSHQGEELAQEAGENTRCSVKRDEPRPETHKEPLFTE
jgi:hypothetical protein